MLRLLTGLLLTCTRRRNWVRTRKRLLYEAPALNKCAEAVAIPSRREVHKGRFHKRARRGENYVIESTSARQIFLSCAISHASHHLEAIVKTSLLEHPHREPRQHFPARAAANNFVDFPQVPLPEKTIECWMIFLVRFYSPFRKKEEGIWA